MKVGYARVSDKEQNLERQIRELNQAGVEKIFQEKKSGKNVQDREEFQKALDFLREGDILIIDSLERLGRNYDDIINNVRKLDQEEIGLNVLNLPILNQELGDPLLQKLIRSIIIQLLSWMAENERKENRRKQRQGIKIAKEKGIYKGRKPKYTMNHPAVKHAIELRQTTNKSVKEICEITNLSEATFYRRWREVNKRN